MSYPAYRTDLQRIHASEVYGLAVFDTAARIARDDARKRRWLVLRALEVQTLDRYLAFMRDAGLAVQAPTGSALKGRVEGAALGMMPWRLAMKMLVRGTQPFQETFHRLVAHADEEERAFFAYVLAHEEAIEAFARKELAGEAESLQPVEALLEG